MASWVRDGVSGLQSVVLYSLPELDGAVDTVPLGGLVGPGDKRLPCTRKPCLPHLPVLVSNPSGVESKAGVVGVASYRRT